MFRSYRDAGVDIDAGNELVRLIKPYVRSTFRPEVKADIGGFASLFALNTLNYKNPLLVSGTDGVGTKLKIAFMTGRLDTVGIDLVAMCVNDVITCGAEPLFFLDYFACGKLEPQAAASVIKGIAEGCKEAGCALVGGETAEMPDFYPAGEFDLAGFAVGVVDRDVLIDGSGIAEGDRVIGVASTGLHSNGYSLARKIVFEQLGLTVDDRIEGFRGTVGEELLTPTRIYAKTLRNLTRNFAIKGVAHITGGGLLENVPRILPERAAVRFQRGSWEAPGVFETLRRAGGIDDAEMWRTFNMGIGLAIVCPEDEVENILIRLSGLQERAWVIGEIVAREDRESPAVEVVG
ncbi:MAG: phosphoribosylformylglycinamidine cyclo-ligase [Deltaproteobacteria bacterium]|nr:phosphoribosylformylglycinamidine cyclo-ligase [Deltaproteobacteria bacterium]